MMVSFATTAPLCVFEKTKEAYKLTAPKTFKIITLVLDFVILREHIKRQGVVTVTKSEAIQKPALVSAPTVR